MHRFQKFIRLLPAERWTALYEEAQQQLTPKNRELLLSLRQTPHPITFRGSTKESVQRIERWVWRYLWKQRYCDYPIYRSPPPLPWVIEGAQAYYVIGLKHDAIKLLQYLISVERERLLIPERMQLIHWCIEVGQFQEAIHELTALKRRLKSIHEYIKRARLLLCLASVMDRYHGLSPSPSLQKRIEKIAASNRWSDPLPDDPALRALEKNIRGTWALLHLDPTEAQKWYQPDPDMDAPHTVALRANLWLSYLYQRAPVEAILPIIQTFSIAELTPHQRASVLERICETYLHYIPLDGIRQVMPLLRRAFLLQGEVSPSIELLRIRLFWLGKEDFPYEKELKAFCKHKNYSVWMRWMGILFWTLIRVEERNYNGFQTAFAEMTRFLRYRKKRLPAALPVLHFLKGFVRQRWTAQKLREAAETWKAYLESSPREKFFWHNTLFHIWIEAHLQGKDVKDHKAQQIVPGYQALNAELLRLLKEWE